MRSIHWIKLSVWIACLFPVSLLIWQFFNNQLGANPLDEINDRLGEWALRLLLVTLCMTPLRRLTGQAWPIQIRRLLGLFCFFYALLHLFAYLVFEQFFDWPEIWLDILDRPFITVGMLSFVILLVLAATSNRFAQRRLGRNWLKIHRLVYVVGFLVLLHFFWLVKFDTRTPTIYAILFAVLMIFRFVAWFKKRSKAAE